MTGDEIVVDASVALKWVLDETDSDWARALLRPGLTLIAPDLLLIEAANALWRINLRGRISAEDSNRAFNTLTTAPVRLERPKAALHIQALAHAASLQHPVYDCLYLALAMSRGIALATADARFAGRLRRAALPTLRLLTPPPPASP